MPPSEKHNWRSWYLSDHFVKLKNCLQPHKIIHQLLQLNHE